MALIEVDDLTPFSSIPEEKAQAMIDDAVAMAELVAPCITDNNFAYPAAVKAIIRGAILRWNETGTGAAVSQVAGVFQQTVTPQTRKSLFWPSEIDQLQRLCASAGGRSFEVDLTPAGAGVPAIPDGYDYYPWDVPPVDGFGPVL